MPSETFYCPNCSRQLTKSAQAYVLGEMMSNEDANFIGLGEMPESVTCPGCGAAIDTKKMINGDYDHPLGWIGWTAGWPEWTAGVVAFGALVGYFEWPWWFAAICGYLVGVTLGIARAKLRANSNR